MQGRRRAIAPVSARLALRARHLRRQARGGRPHVDDLLASRGAAGRGALPARAREHGKRRPIRSRARDARRSGRRLLVRHSSEKGFTLFTSEPQFPEVCHARFTNRPQGLLSPFRLRDPSPARRVRRHRDHPQEQLHREIQEPGHHRRQLHGRQGAPEAEPRQQGRRPSRRRTGSRDRVAGRRGGDERPLPATRARSDPRLGADGPGGSGARRLAALVRARRRRQLPAVRPLSGAHRQHQPRPRLRDPSPPQGGGAGPRRLVQADRRLHLQGRGPGVPRLREPQEPHQAGNGRDDHHHHHGGIQLRRVRHPAQRGSRSCRRRWVDRQGGDPQSGRGSSSCATAG